MPCSTRGAVAAAREPGATGALTELNDLREAA
jgi:hypothetical protein